MLIGSKLFRLHHRFSGAAVVAFFIALSLSTGIDAQGTDSAQMAVEKCWAYPLGDRAGVGISVSRGQIFVGFADGSVESLGDNGKKLWSGEFGGVIVSNLLASESAFFLVTAARPANETVIIDSVLRAISRETGITLWTLKLAGVGDRYLHNYADSIIVTSASGAISSIDAKTGRENWKREIAAGFVTEPAYNGKSFSLAGTGKQIFNVALATGEIEGMRRFGDTTVTTIAAAATDGFAAGDDRGNLSVYFDSGKPKWTFRTGGGLSQLHFVNTGVLAASRDNFLYLFNRRSGDVEWKNRLPSRVSYLAVMEAGYAIFSTLEGAHVSIVGLGNGRTVAQIPMAEGEVITHDPVSSGKQIYLLTSLAVYSYGLGGCSPRKAE